MVHSAYHTEPDSPAESSLATSIFDSPKHSVSDADKREAQIAKWRFSTLAANVDTKDQYGASSTPIYQTATFKGVNGEYDYTRSGNPTRGGLESHLARLYGAYSAFALSTGMTCLDMILRLVKPGETVLAGDDIYGGTNRLLTYLSTHGGVDVKHLDTTRPEMLLPHLGEGNKVTMVLLESPTNPLLKVADLEALATLVKSRSPGALVVVDNTMMSPYLQRPLHLGADIVYDSGTKYLSGHHDVMAGVIAVKDEAIHKRIAFMINSVGSGLAPFDSFLLLRGVKTISLRMDRQMATAQLVADYLDNLGFLVHYPGLKHHPKRDVHYKQATGAGAVLSFVTDDKALSERIVGGTRLWGISVSFGAVNSLISMPCMMSHASISAAVRAERGLPENLIRLCVGIEDPRDLIDDLEAALLSSGAIIHNLSYSPRNPVQVEAMFDTNPSAWILERARAFKRPGEETAMARLVQGVKRSLGMGQLDRKKIDSEVVVSAPGKVILFGEHAVVHGVTAIATSVNLRCYAVLTPRSDDKIALEVPNLGLEMEWDIDALPWVLLPIPAGQSSRPSRQIADKDLDSPLLEFLETLVHDSHTTVKSAVGAAVAWLYLYMTMAGSETEAFSATFTASSNLPISAGLGSSAAYSTCIASALLLAHQTIPTPASSSSFSPEETNIIDGWAFLSEKVLHGNPSGIDNAVSVRGGAVAFTRAVGGRPGGLDVLGGFDSVRLLLTNTLVERDTKTLVAGVAKLREEQAEMVGEVMRSIQGISDEARSLLGGEEVERARLIERLEALIKDNHAHLVSLKVSHPSLETIVAATSTPPYNLSTKLTGAGGGGCAVTLIPDEYDGAKLSELMDVLRKSGFEPHLTTLGGKGAGVLRREKRQGKGRIVGRGEDEGVGMPLRAGLREVGKEGVGKWAESLGDWVYT